MSTSASVGKSTGLRWLINVDMPQILEIERLSFSGHHCWIQEEFRRQLKKRNCVGMVMTALENTREIQGYMVFELHQDHILLTNMAVHPACRENGVARQMLDFLRTKTTNQREKIIALVPESLPGVQPFCKHNGLAIRLTHNKGLLSFQPKIVAMEHEDIPDVQALADRELPNSQFNCWIIEDMLKAGWQGIIARESFDNTLLGYALFEVYNDEIIINGEFGIMVKSEARRQGVGTMLFQELAKKGPMQLRNVNLGCDTQRAFLSTMGVSVPYPNLYATIEVPKRASP